MKKLISMIAVTTALMASAVAALPAQAANYQVAQKTLSVFSGSSTSLTTKQKAEVKAAVEASPDAEKFICTGIRYVNDPTSVNIMVRARAKAACAYAKELNPGLSTWYQNKPTKAKSYAGKVLLTVKTALAQDTVITALEKLTVASEADAASYDRAAFADWIDADGDGCDTRIEVLQAEGIFPSKPSGCSITGGSWTSAYDLVMTSDASSFDIDHMVPLAEAWRSGASSWTDATRDAFANDLTYSGSLIAVSASSNRSKGDRDPSGWMPGNQAFKCEYLEMYVSVKYRWSLTIDASEKSAISTKASDCTGEFALPAKASVESATASPSPSPVSATLDPRFATCTAAKAAGYGPYVKGVDPEYEWYRDADKDGTVCE